MALVLKDRVKETTIVTGTGTATLLGSSIGFQSFSVVGNGNTTYYCISDQFGSNWEVGLGTYSSSGNTLARTTVLSSSNAGSLVTFTAGIKDVFVTYPSSEGLWKDASGNAIGLGTPAAFVATNVTGLPLSTGVTGTLQVVNGGTGVTTSTGIGSTVLSASPTFTGTLNSDNLAYTGTLTGGTGVVIIGTNQIYKDASGNIGIGTGSTSGRLTLASTSTDTTNYYNGTRLSLQNLSTTNGNFTEMSFLSANGNDYAAIWGVCASHAANATTGAIVFGTTNAAAVATERMRIDAAGNLLVGATSVIANGKINSVFDQASQSGMGFKNTSATATGYYCAFYNSAGTLQGSITQTSSTVTAYNVTSDKRLKIDKGVATDTSVIDKTTIHDFEWKADGVLDRGVFAQEAQLVKPSAVTKGKDDLNEEGNILHPWAVDYAKYVPDLIVYCQQLKKQNQEQQTLIEALTARLTALEAK